MPEPATAATDWISLNDVEQAGRDMYALMGRLYPICRSITGEGVRETLTILNDIIPLQQHEVPTGTPVFDWVVPKEWTIRDAYVKNSKGVRVVDFKKSNLHVVNYSVPVHKTMGLMELKTHLHSIPDQPDWVPYRTSYYAENWGFCLAHRDVLALEDDTYEVYIDASLEAGTLTYGEYYLPGESQDEVLVYTHTCHPSLANDNLSGIAVVTQLARLLAGHRRRYSYRFVYGPGTIGSITWLSRNEARLGAIQHGLVIALVGDPGPFTYKKSRHGNAVIDRAALIALRDRNEAHRTLEFSPYGYDERQFCSPGINLPMGRLTRSPNSAYPEYHTSADNLDLVRPEMVAKSLAACVSIVNILEHNRCYLNLSPKCEPQLGKRGLYSKTGGGKDVGQREYALLWVLNLSDGRYSLLDIAERSGLGFEAIYQAARELTDAGLLRLT
jgi:aminopeptidase-like protein